MFARSLSNLLVGLSMLACASVYAAPVVYTLNNVESVGGQGDPGNTVVSLNVGAGAHVTSIAYDVNVTAFSPSWLSEITLGFTNDSGAGVFFSPSDVDGSGNGSYADSASLVDLGLDFFIGADGILYLEFFEGLDDGGVSPDGVWNFGTITFGIEGGTVPPTDVPEPASILLLGAGAAALAYNRRRRAA